MTRFEHPDGISAGHVRHATILNCLASQGAINYSPAFQERFKDEFGSLAKQKLFIMLRRLEGAGLAGRHLDNLRLRALHEYVSMQQGGSQPRPPSYDQVHLIDNPG